MSLSDTSCYEQEQDGQQHTDLVEGREAAVVLPAVYVTTASSPFSGRHLSFVPLAGNGNVDFHGDSSVNRDLLGISARLACQRKCLVLDSILIRGPLATLLWFSLFLLVLPLVVVS